MAGKREIMLTPSSRSGPSSALLLGLLSVTLSAAAQAAERAPAVMGTPENSFSTSLLAPGSRPDVGAPTPIEPGAVLGPTARVTVFSRDRSRALILYQDILGMAPITNNYWRGLAINRVKGTVGLEQHAVILTAGASPEGNIGVYQLYREKFGPPPIDTSKVIKTGDYALTFVTNDIQKIFGRLNEFGFTVITPPTVQPASGPAPGATKLTIRGPDGVIVNFIQPPK